MVEAWERNTANILAEGDRTPPAAPERMGRKEDLSFTRNLQGSIEAGLQDTAITHETHLPNTSGRYTQEELARIEDDFDGFDTPGSEPNEINETPEVPSDKPIKPSNKQLDGFEREIMDFEALQDTARDPLSMSSREKKASYNESVRNDIAKERLDFDKSKFEYQKERDALADKKADRTSRLDSINTGLKVANTVIGTAAAAKALAMRNKNQNTRRLI